MKLIDTHCHIYLEEFDLDRATMIERAVQQGVERFYLPAIDSHSRQAILDLQAQYPKMVFAMAGLHPCSVKENYEVELRVVEQDLADRPYSAVGEIGLDFYWDKTYIKEQQLAFEAQIELALQFKLPIVIHSRNATLECIATVAKYVPRGLRGIFHCFGGSLEEAKSITGLGFYLGIGGVVTYKNAGLAEVLKEVAPEFLVLETDAPYLTPVPFRGKRNESAYLSYVVDKLALIKDCPPAEIARVTTENAQKIFGN